MPDAGACSPAASRRRVGLALAAFALCGVAAAQVVAAEGPDQAPSAIDVRIGDVDVDGAFRPQPGARVEVLPMRADAQGDVELGEPLTLTADADGRVALPPEAAPGNALLRYPGESGLAVATLEGRTLRLGRYQLHLGDDDVEAEVRAQLDVGDGALRAWQLLTLRVKRAGVRRWTAASPLIVPLLAPLRDGEVADRAFTLEEARAARVSVQGEGEARFIGGQLQLIGSVAPGRPLALRVATTISAKTPELALGLRGVVGATRLTLAIVATAPAAPRLRSVRPARIGAHRDGEERLVGLAWLQPLPRGETGVVELADLPVPARAPRRALLGFGALALLISAAVVLRRPATADPDRGGDVGAAAVGVAAVGVAAAAPPTAMPGAQDQAPDAPAEPDLDTP